MTGASLFSKRPLKKHAGYFNTWLQPFQPVPISNCHALRMNVEREDEQYRASLTLFDSFGETKYPVVDHWLIDAQRKHGMLIFVRAAHYSKGKRPERLLVEVVFLNTKIYHWVLPAGHA